MEDKKHQSIFVGTVDHGCGVNNYASDTREGVVRQIADFARYWYSDMCYDGADPAKLDDQAVIDAYFGSDVNTESYEINEVEIIPLADIPMLGSTGEKEPADGRVPPQA